MTGTTVLDLRTDSGRDRFSLPSQKWGAVASFLVAVTSIVAPFIYLTGNLREAFGPFAYALADLLYGPVWAASLVTAVFALRERIGGSASRRMTLALLAAALAATVMLAVATIRSANRQYHLIHPELHLEDSQTILIVWTTLVAGLTGAAWHLLGWAQALIGSAGWASGRLPRPLSVLYLAAGAASLLVYAFPANEGTAGVLTVAVSIWQGILLWNTTPKAVPGPDPTRA